jgi:mannose-6-phosphate isomerase-like protein (cupin superfamily)
MKTIALSLAVTLLCGAACAAPTKNMPNSNPTPMKTPVSYHTNLFKDTQANENFRKVLFTGGTSQLVVMSIPPGGEVGNETHKFTEQTLLFLSGSGEAIVAGRRFPIGPGDVVVVTVGTEHNFLNTGATDLKIITVYAPANHIDGRVHRTKAEAAADTADEEFGEAASAK